MKHTRFILLQACILALFSSINSYGYDNEKTHKEITSRSIEIYGINLDLNDQAAAKIILREGAYQEDLPNDKVTLDYLRWRSFNHFMDPSNSDKGFHNILINLGTPYANARDFAVDSDVQNTWLNNIGRSGSTDDNYQIYSYQRAKELFTSDKAAAYKSLGHVAHLLQDMGSPPHVRNDAHVANEWTVSSPFTDFISYGQEYEYEYYVKNNLNSYIDSKILNVIAAPDVKYLFNKFAKYTRDNFFSEDEFSSPPTESIIGSENGKRYLKGYLVSEDDPELKNKQVYLAREGLFKRWNYKCKNIYVADFCDVNIPKYTFYIMDEKVHESYWSILSLKTAQYTASLINKFHEDVRPHAPPVAPILSSPTYSGGQITITWSAISGAAHYVLYWSNSPNITTSNSTRIFPVNDTQYVHSSLTPGSIYYYRVATIDSMGAESLMSNEVSLGPVPSLLPDLQPGTWLRYADMPIKLDGPPVVVNGKIYVFGGWDTNKVLEYDPVLNLWTEKTGMPSARGGTVALEYNGRVYLVGGNPTPWGSSSLEIYDPIQNNWATKSPMPYQLGGWGVAGGIINDKIYVVGGYNWYNHEENFNREYDLVNDTWTLKSSMPIAVSWMNAAVSGNKLYVVGGDYGTGNITWINQIQNYDTSSNTWGTSIEFPVYIDGSGVVSYKNNIYVVGGIRTVPPFPFYWTGVVDNIKSFYNMLIYRFDPMSGAVSSVADMPVSDGGQVVVIGNVLYLVGSGSSGQELWGFGLP